ncbi:MAG: hypothetical protein WC124_00205 [Desulfoplanes sp.]
MAEILVTLQGKFFLSINDTPEIRTIFTDLSIQEATTIYSCS